MSKDVNRFWERNEDLAATCPDIPDLNLAIPYRVYGDGADSHRNQNFEAMTLLPVLASGSSTLDTRILVSVRNCQGTAASARTKISETIAWSLCAMRILVLIATVLLFTLLNFADEFQLQRVPLTIIFS